MAEKIIFYAVITIVWAIAFTGASAPNAIAQTAFVSKVWTSDNGDGTYKNPILHADYSDPDAVRVGDDYYLTASSFNAAPGLPILHSKDLVNWRLINYVFQKQKLQETFNRPQHGGGVWAPATRERRTLTGFDLSRIIDKTLTI